MAESTESLPVAVAPPLSAAERVGYALLFLLLLWALGSVLVVLTVLQLILRLGGGEPNAALVRAGRGLARYVAEVIRFLCGDSMRVPFPFSDWPDEPLTVRREDLAGL